MKIQSLAAAACLTLLSVSQTAAVRVAERSAPPTRQTALEKLRVYGDGDDVDLYQVKDVAYLGAELVVVTAPEPAVHVFTGSRFREWGKKGSGPAELRDPSGVAVAAGNILVSDLNLAKIVSFTAAGGFVTARPVGIISALKAAGTDTLVSAVDLQGGVRTVLRLRGERRDTVLRYRLPEQVTLHAAGSPSLTVVPPYAPVPQWTVLSTGELAFWDGKSPYLSVRALGRAGERRFPLPAASRPVTDADRGEWLADAIPQDFMGRRVFEPLRAAAAGQVHFPDRLPAVLGLLPDPGGGAWVRTTTRATGETWVLVSERGTGRTIHLPSGRQFLAAGPGELAILARSAEGIETVEVYRSPVAAARHGG